MGHDSALTRVIGDVHGEDGYLGLIRFEDGFANGGRIARRQDKGVDLACDERLDLCDLPRVIKFPVGDGQFQADPPRLAGQALLQLLVKLVFVGQESHADQFRSAYFSASWPAHQRKRDRGPPQRQLRISVSSCAARLFPPPTTPVSGLRRIGAVTCKARPDTCRQLDREERTFAHLAPDLDDPVVLHDNLAHDGQSQTRPCTPRGKERVEDPLQLVPRVCPRPCRASLRPPSRPPPRTRS